jgi:hypothetical protein
MALGAPLLGAYRHLAAEEDLERNPFSDLSSCFGELSARVDKLESSPPFREFVQRTSPRLPSYKAGIDADFETISAAELKRKAREVGITDLDAVYANALIEHIVLKEAGIHADLKNMNAAALKVKAREVGITDRDRDAVRENGLKGHIIDCLVPKEVEEATQRWQRAADPAEAATFLATINILKARNLHNVELMDDLDPYIVCFADRAKDKTIKTDYKNNELNPDFYKTGQKLVVGRDDTLVFDCFDRDLLGYDDHWGSVRIPISELLKGGAFFRGEKIRCGQ